MIEKFRARMKENGQSLKWFWNKYLINELTYPYFIVQVNGNASMQSCVEVAIWDYMRETRG